jgi:NAD(P)-dependent dehydrogenase (short-subunit alcohol dehydrogenase family)
VTDIAGRVALVTGGGSGIGRGIALALAAEGASVIVADIGEGRAPETAELIKAAGGTAVAVRCDVSDRASVRAMKEAAERTLGLPTLLFPNAGVTAFDPLDKMTSADIDWMIDVNLKGVFHCVEAFLPHMMAHGSGHICATSSMAGLIPPRIPDHVPYSAAKMGVIGMMLAMRGDYAKHGIGCTVLCPGGVQGRMTECTTVRPERYGGPAAAIPVPTDIIARNKIAFRQPDSVAQMVLRAVRDNRAMVLTDHMRRGYFQELYVDAVMQAFDDCEAFAAEEERLLAGQA